MTYRQLMPLGMIVFLWLAGCGGSSEVILTPLTTEVATPSPIPRATRSPVALGTRAISTPTRTLATPTPAGPLPTATSTREPTPSAALSRAANDLDDRLDDFRAAVRDGDNQRALNLQRDLLVEVDKGEQIARAERTRWGEQMLAALSTLRLGLAGDLPKLDAARVELRKIGGRAGAPSGTPGAGPAGQLIDNLQMFAGQLADKVASFRAAQARNDTAALLSLQNDLLAEITRVDTQLKDSHARQAELVRSAAGDLRSGMAGETNKLALAESKLREAAGQSSQPTPSAVPATATAVATATPAATATLQPSPSAQPRAGAQ